MNENLAQKIDEMRRRSMSYSKIAAALSISENSIKSYVHRRKQQKEVIEDNPSVCRHCGKALEKAKYRPRVFCSDKCRMAWWNKHPEMASKGSIKPVRCMNCNRAFTAAGHRRRKFCSHQCYIDYRYHRGQCHD